MCGHLAKHRFMPSYLVWHLHGEVHTVAAAESDRSDDEDQMDDMTSDIGIKYDLEISSHHWKCQISIGSLPPLRRKCTMGPRWPYYRLWHVLWGWTQSIISQICATMLSWSLLLISNQRSTTCQKTCTCQRKLLPVSEWTMRRLMPAKKNACCSERSTRTILNVCIAVGPDTRRW
jgi:hypothetical protein